MLHGIFFLIRIQFIFYKDEIYVLQMQSLSHKHWKEVLGASLGGYPWPRLDPLIVLFLTQSHCNIYQIMHFFFYSRFNFLPRIVFFKCLNFPCLSQIEAEHLQHVASLQCPLLRTDPKHSSKFTKKRDKTNPKMYSSAQGSHDCH